MEVKLMIEDRYFRELLEKGVAALEKIAEAMERTSIPYLMQIKTTDSLETAEPEALVPEKTLPVTEVVSEPKKPLPTVSEVSYTLEQLVSVCRPLIDAGHKDDISAIIKSLGYGLLSELPPEKYPEFAEGLRNLGGDI